MSVAHHIIISLWECLDFYENNKTAGEAARILQYLDIWKGLHTATVNISDNGWDELKILSLSLGINAAKRSELQRLLFVLETYLATLMKLILLQRRGTRVITIRDLQTAFDRVRGIIEEDLLEWFVDASSDVSIPEKYRKNLTGSFELMSNTLWEVDLGRINFDLFREIYQNILGSGIRKSLGEFYTNEDLVKKTLESSSIDDLSIINVYKKYEANKEVQIFLDPACGSGTFLTVLIEKISAILAIRGVEESKICDFLVRCIVGIDINPFAVYMAKLNILLKLTQLMPGCQPGSLRIIWADSLTKYERNVTPNGLQSLTLKIPFLAGFISEGTVKIELPEPEHFLSLEELIDVVDQFASAQLGKQKLRARLQEIGGNVSQNLGGYMHLIEDLYDTIRRIHEGGNSRLVKLLKNIIKTHDIRGRCKYVIGNPPWVRIHRIHPIVLRYLKLTYSVFDSSKSYNPDYLKTVVPFGSQFDYSMAFVESGLDYLEDGGVLGYVITSKIMQTTYAGELRRILLNLEIMRIIDYSLHKISLFQDAVNYPLIIAVKKTNPKEAASINTTIHNTEGRSRSFGQSQSELSLYQLNQRSPWVLGPPSILTPFRKMQKFGLRLGDVYEIMRGVVTANNDVYIVKSINSVKGNTAEVILEDGNKINIEHNIICPLIRGRDIDPFTYTTSSYLLFTHNSKGDILCHTEQAELLLAITREMNKLRRKKEHDIKVSANGDSLVYSAPINTSNLLANLKMSFVRLGFNITNFRPCVVAGCWKVTKGGNETRVSIESSNRTTKVIIGNLEIPGMPEATLYFKRKISPLLKRDDYKPGQIPWTIFRVSDKKFSRKVAWQENATEIEAAILPKTMQITIGKREYTKPLIPLQTTYFVVPNDPADTTQLLLYLNSDLARSFMKLVCWKGQGGFFRHISASMGHLPLPDRFGKTGIAEKTEIDREEKDEDDTLSEPSSQEWEQFLDAIRESLGVTTDESDEFIEYGRWLNEIVDVTAIEKQPEELEEVEV